MITGKADVFKSYEKYLKQSQMGTQRGLQQVADDVLNDSNAIIPIKTGFLRNSGTARVTGVLSFEVKYDADYAIFVHENLNAFHPIGSAKFLLIALMKNSKVALYTIKGELP